MSLIINKEIHKELEKIDGITQLKTTLDNFSGESIKIKGTFNATSIGTLSTGNPIIDMAKYHTVLDGLENITIDFARDSKILLDCSSSENPNAIVLKNCSNVTIKNLYVEGFNQTNITEHQLTQGNGIYMINCKNCYIEKSTFKDTCGGVYILSSIDCHVYDCVHSIKLEMSTSSPTKKSTGSFIISQSENCTIERCDSYGGTGDGNIFLGGGHGQYNCHIINCRVYNYAKNDTTKTLGFVEAQGICIDGSNYNCSVKGNYVYGFAYGIDNKNYSWETTIVNNVVKNCYIGIASRPGDQGLNNPDIFSCKIEGNTINPNGGNGATQAIPSYTSFVQETAPIGILVHDSYGMLIDNNVIENNAGLGNKNFIHVAVYLEKDYDIDKNQQGIIIANNRFSSFTKRYTEIGYSTSKMVLIKGKNKSGTVTIENNTFIPFFDNVTDIDNIIYVNSTSYTVNIKNNHIGRIKGSIAISISNVIILNFSSNTFDLHSGILYVDPTVIYSNIDNNVSWQQNSNVSNKIYDIKTNTDVVFSNNKYFGRSGLENNYLTISSPSCRAIVQNNTILTGYLTIGSMLSIATTNKIVSGNVGATGTGVLTTITG